MYFGGINGITAFYPAQIDKEEDKPMPYISSLSVNGKVRERYIAPGATPSYTLAYDENVIQLRLLGKGLRSPRSYNFQYMVKGLHEEWINLGRNMDIQLQLPRDVIPFTITSLLVLNLRPKRSMNCNSGSSLPSISVGGLSLFSR